MADNQVVTNGGRVLAVVAMEMDLLAAANRARLGAELIEYEGKFFRRDIAHRAIHRCAGNSTFFLSGADF